MVKIRKRIFIVKVIFMFKKKKRIILIFIVTLILCGISIFLFLFENNSVEALSKYGSRGNEVTQIQTKLKRWGYYNGNIDGIYGTQTVNAVKYFQRKNGLTQDGIAGPATLKAMGIYNSSGNTGSTSNSSNPLRADSGFGPIQTEAT